MALCIKRHPTALTVVVLLSGLGVNNQMLAPIELTDRAALQDLSH
jgi:hypothetical protein